MLSNFFLVKTNIDVLYFLTYKITVIKYHRTEMPDLSFRDVSFYAAKISFVIIMIFMELVCLEK